VEAPVVSTVHLPVAPQLYIGAGVGTHDEAQPVFVSAPEPAVHLLVAGSVHV
jgi:hypothetical protein